MKRRIVTALAVAPICLLFLTCNKSQDLRNNPLNQGCQVAEYHVPTYDNDISPSIHYLFKKTFDPSGKTVKEIECFFNDIVPPNSIQSPEFHHILEIKQNGRKIFLINELNNSKGKIPDTVAQITLNNDGRAISCVANGELDPDRHLELPPTEYYFYKDNRIVAVKTEFLSNTPDAFSTLDSLYYDDYGNILAFRDNSYQYDLTRKARQQFYCDDLMDGDEPFYLLEYLGFFPEVTSPTNIRTRLVNTVFHLDLTNHQFDSEGKLISYSFTDMANPISISWNCVK